MSIRKHFNKSIIIKRIRDLTGFKKDFVTTGTVDAHLQKISGEDASVIYGVYGATHKAWVDVNEDIQVGDKVTDPDNVEYEVVAIEKHDYGLSVEHLEVILKKYNA